MMKYMGVTIGNLFWIKLMLCQEISKILQNGHLKVGWEPHGYTLVGTLEIALDRRTTLIQKKLKKSCPRN